MSRKHVLLSLCALGATGVALYYGYDYYENNSTRGLEAKYAKLSPEFSKAMVSVRNGTQGTYQSTNSRLVSPTYVTSRHFLDIISKSYFGELNKEFILTSNSYRQDPSIDRFIEFAKVCDKMSELDIYNYGDHPTCRYANVIWELSQKDPEVIKSLALLGIMASAREVRPHNQTELSKSLIALEKNISNFDLGFTYTLPTSEYLTQENVRSHTRSWFNLSVLERRK
ncbi:hypothetical protein CJP74_01675 [Psittacicella melopsittaci]|uniref:Uncharacterized protein n=1 Tax=Psittacicella melopsittaci TaxID=2028576 RepID=A0A3A1Y7H1_9GAMM|nr:hypothetical protein [Psittacicella melopsittaci]RIY33461.1 hypothetical protein CJP74_01675 [Psittacicella melopsittaci]